MNGVGLSIDIILEVGYQVFTCPVFYFMLGAMLIDMITGIGKALITGTYSSSIGINGIVRHSMVLLLAIFLGFFFRIFGMAPVALTILAILGLNYVVSIVENMQVAGVNFPDSIKNLFIQMRDKAEDEIVRAEDVNVIITKGKKSKINDKKGVDR